MSDDEPDSLVLRCLRRLDAKLDGIDARLNDLSADVRGIKAHMAGCMQRQIVRDGALASIRDRLDKAERRLDLREQGT